LHLLASDLSPDILQTKEKNIWVKALDDSLANVHCMSAGMQLVDLDGSGDYRLVIADSEKKLKVFKGLFVSPSILSYVFCSFSCCLRWFACVISSRPFLQGSNISGEYALLDVPCAVAAFYSDSNKVPCVAVAVRLLSSPSRPRLTDSRTFVPVWPLHLHLSRPSPLLQVHSPIRRNRQQRGGNLE